MSATTCQYYQSLQRFCYLEILNPAIVTNTSQLTIYLNCRICNNNNLLFSFINFLQTSQNAVFIVSRLYYNFNFYVTNLLIIIVHCFEKTNLFEFKILKFNFRSVFFWFSVYYNRGLLLYVPFVHAVLSKQMINKISKRG